MVQDSKKVKMTLMLDEDTIAILKAYSYDELKETNVSKAVRLLAKNYDNIHKPTSENDTQ